MDNHLETGSERLDPLPHRDKVIQIMDYLEQRKPIQWIEHELGVRRNYVSMIGTVAGRGKYKARRITLDQYLKLQDAVEDGWSLSDITRTYGHHPDTVKYWFPNAGWGQGGSEEQAIVSHTLREIKKAEKGKYA